jgi:hypothetical protein
MLQLLITIKRAASPERPDPRKSVAQLRQLSKLVSEPPTLGGLLEARSVSDTTILQILMAQMPVGSLSASEMLLYRKCGRLSYLRGLTKAGGMAITKKDGHGNRSW